MAAKWYGSGGSDSTAGLVPSVRGSSKRSKRSHRFRPAPLSEGGVIWQKQLLSQSASPNPRQENLNTPNRDSKEPATATWLPSAALLNLGDPTPLIELLPMAAYAAWAPHGVIAWSNSRAAQLWGRAPVIGDTDERFCGAHKLFYPDGTYMAHCDTPVALVLNTGTSTRKS